MHLKKHYTVIFWILSFLSISFLIGETTRQNMGWYQNLEKSPLTPPNLAFPIVWTTLYIMLACVGYILWKNTQTKYFRKSFFLFCLYMIINWAWSFIFFAGHFIMTGFIWILFSDYILGILILNLWKNNERKIAFLLIPTFLWGIFAAYLNGFIAF